LKEAGGLGCTSEFQRGCFLGLGRGEAGAIVPIVLDDRKVKNRKHPAMSRVKDAFS
jgi:hypothetical protein